MLDYSGLFIGSLKKELILKGFSNKEIQIIFKKLLWEFRRQYNKYIKENE